MAGRTSLFFAAALGVLALRPPAPAGAPACMATLDPDTILRGTAAASVTYGLSEAIGTIDRVTTPEDSRLKVSGVDPTTTMVTFDAQGAVAGDWDVTFHGADQKTCVGTLHVQGMAR